MGALKQPSYEDARQQRLEENKRRLEELGLGGLSRTISNIFRATKASTPRSPQKPRNVKTTVPTELLDSRRSPRISKKPVPLYKDMDEEFPRLRRSSTSSGTRAGGVRQRVCSFISDQARDDAATTASCMETNHPSFVKRMLPSHVSSCFWLGLPLSFCKAHLPKNDQYMKLVNEEGDQWESLYLARKTGLSAGWKRFAEENDLRDGDALLFELVQYNQFNVRIVRVACYDDEAKNQHHCKDEEGGGTPFLKGELVRIVRVACYDDEAKNQHHCKDEEGGDLQQGESKKLKTA